MKEAGEFAGLFVFADIPDLRLCVTQSVYRRFIKQKRWNRQSGGTSPISFRCRAGSANFVRRIFDE
jgi:hypothetical protein